MIQIDIEMPDCCGNCPCFHFENPMYCRARTDVHQRVTAPYCSPRPEWCPLHEVPDKRTVKWVSVTDRLPPEHDTIFAKLKGTDKWKPGMMEKVSDDVSVKFLFEDGSTYIGHNRTIDGRWECEHAHLKPWRKVIAWTDQPEGVEEKEC